MGSVKLDFNDLLIVPATTSTIRSRTEVKPFTSRGFLPIMTAPMDTVISAENVEEFIKNKVDICLPRNVDYSFGFKSFSISEMEAKLLELPLKTDSYLIDVANGHMSVLLDLTKALKEANPDITLMVGNVANAETYGLLSDAGADYVRVGIGNGGGCLTTQHTGVGYPMASLIKECYEVSTTLRNPALIVADGGMQTYSDIIKALALGADLVMLGSILNKCLESCGDNYVKDSESGEYIPLTNETFKRMKTTLISKGTLYKKFRGMSTKEVQKEWNVGPLKTSEGVVKYNRVEYTLSQWVENFEAYLRSAMSYTGSLNLRDFIGQVNLIQISDNAYKRFNK